jgi:hypothetical protein
MEELIAELGVAFLSADLDLTPASVGRDGGPVGLHHHFREGERRHPRSACGREAAPSRNFWPGIGP